MNKSSVVLLIFCLGFATTIGAQTCEVCVPTASNATELSQLESSLTSLGFSFQTADDPTATSCNVYLTYPSSNYTSS